MTISGFNSIDGGPYPASSEGPIWTFSDNLTHIRGRHTLKAGVFVEYSGEDDFDQINVSILPGDTNNQNGRFEFNDGRTGGTGLAVANAAMGLFTNYGEIGPRSKTDWRALAVDAFVQDSWKARDNLTVEGGFRYVYWPPWHAKLNNAAMFNPEFYDPARAVRVDPRTGAIVPNSGDPYNGDRAARRRLPRRRPQGEIQAAGNPEHRAPVPRRARRVLARRTRPSSSRGSASPTASTRRPRCAWEAASTTRALLLNDSTLLGGNPPIQFKVGVTNGIVDQPAGATRAEFPLVMTDAGPGVQPPDGLQLERVAPARAAPRHGGRRHVRRAHGPAPAARAQHQPAPARHRPGQPRRQRQRPAALPRASRPSASPRTPAGRSTTGCSSTSSAGSATAWASASPTRSPSCATTAPTSGTCSTTPTTTAAYWAISDNDRTHLFNVHYLYELPFWRKQDTLVKKLLGRLAGLGRDLLPVRACRCRSRARRTSPASATPRRSPGTWSAIPTSTTRSSRTAAPSTRTSGSTPPPSRVRRRAPSATAAATPEGLRGPAFQSWDIALFKNIPLGGSKRLQLRLEAFNFINHPLVGESDRERTPPRPAAPTARSAASTSTPTAPTSGACSPRRASATSSWG